jgi:phage shock protein PspC (stress-responsive transcriptional regulator)
MNKTININLSGIIYHLDEGAYENFNLYLNAIKDRLSHEEGGAEIVADIESRIAEIFSMRLSEGKRQVVTQEDVDFIISTLGSPEDFADATDDTDTTQTETKRRFFRNPDETVIGGVCSGIAAYFNIDVVWIRVLFLVLLFFTGIGFITYIILWAAIPEAKTTAQKLQMRGEPVNLGNIEKKFKEFEAQGKAFGKKFKNTPRGFFDFITNTIGAILGFILKLFGVVLAIVGSVIAFTLIVALIGVFGSTWNLGGFDFIDINGYIYGMDGAQALFGSGWRLMSLRVGTLLTLFSFSGIASFIIGLILIFISAGSLTTDFKERSTEVETIPVQGNSLVLEADILEESTGFLFDIDDDQLRVENVRFNIEQTNDSTAHLELKHSASGRNHAEARQRAQRFDFKTEQTGETLRLSEYFSVPEDALYRGQDLKVTLRLPVGTTVFLDPSLENIIYDLENVQNLWDSDMLGHTWIMTGRGLDCADCPVIEYYSAEDLEETIEEELEAMDDEIDRKIEELELEIKRLKDR